MSTKTEEPEGVLKTMATAAKGSFPNRGGRPRGAVNKATMTAREAIAAFVDDNSRRMDELLDQIAGGVPKRVVETGEIVKNTDGTIAWQVEPNPKAAFDAIQSVIEYHIPKLARVEQTGKDGGPITTASLVANLDLKGLSDGELDQVLTLLGRATPGQS